ncbi:MAG: HAD family phosphatase [Myxococcota bacterium]|nr:HAD family phosphatase [Myxococcota bacterium]
MTVLPTLWGIEASLFDMDGTLVLTEDRTDAAITALLDTHHISMGDLDLSRFHGVTWVYTAAQLTERWPTLADVDIPSELQRLFQGALVAEPPRPVPGAVEAVRAAAAVMPTAIVTSSNRETAELVCDQLEIRAPLGAVITAEDCTSSKPSPQPFMLAAERLGVDPRRCLVFEDSAAGVQGAKAAGASVIAIGAESGHASWISDYGELPRDFFTRAVRPTDD